MLQSVEYERLVRDVYQAIQQTEGLDTTKLLHNQRIQGKSGLRHQVDIYWELKIDGNMSRVAIECKHYSRRVDIGKVRDFLGVLHDIGDIRGILVTKVGFESGAITFADHYGIQLKEVRFPQQQDWHGRLKDVPLEIKAFKPIILCRNITPDTQWLLQERKVNPQDRFVSFSVAKDFEDHINIYNELGEKVSDFFEMRRDLPHQFLEEQGLRHTYSFANGYIDSNEFGRIKISRIEFVYDVVAATVEATTEGDEIARAIIRDVKTNQIQLLDKHGAIRC
jgi:hypothetical protein